MKLSSTNNFLMWYKFESNPKSSTSWNPPSLKKNTREENVELPIGPKVWNPACVLSIGYSLQCCQVEFWNAQLNVKIMKETKKSNIREIGFSTDKARQIAFSGQIFSRRLNGNPDSLLMWLWPFYSHRVRRIRSVNLLTSAKILKHWVCSNFT